MRHKLFASMKEQLNPSLRSQAELSDALARSAPANGRETHPRRWATLAACASLVLAISGAVALQDTAPQPRQHSYTTVEGVFQPIREQKNPIDGGGRDAATQTGGGELPGGATVGGDVAVQAGAEAYELLMKGLDGELPDWYGGAYIDAGGGLTVLLVDGENPGDKSLELQVLEWTGDAGVAFTSARYSLAHLNRLMARLDEELPPLVEEGGWSVNMVDNRIDLDILFPVDAKVLTLLAELDPGDDAIRVNAYTEKAYQAQFEQKAIEDAPAKVKLGEEPVPGGVMDGDPDGYDVPTRNTQSKGITELPAEKAEPSTPAAEQEEPAHYDLLPLDE